MTRKAIDVGRAREVDISACAPGRGDERLVAAKGTQGAGLTSSTRHGSYRQQNCEGKEVEEKGNLAVSFFCGLP